MILATLYIYRSALVKLDQVIQNMPLPFQSRRPKLKSAVAYCARGSFYKYIQCYSYTLHGCAGPVSSQVVPRANLPPNAGYSEIPNSVTTPANPSLVIPLQSLAGSSLNTHSAPGRPTF